MTTFVGPKLKFLSLFSMPMKVHERSSTVWVVNKSFFECFFFLINHLIQFTCWTDSRWF